jgi:hypothetical protein
MGTYARRNRWAFVSMRARAQWVNVADFWWGRKNGHTRKSDSLGIPLCEDISSEDASSSNFKSNFYSVLFTSFDRVWVVDHENLLFGLSKCFLAVENHENIWKVSFFEKHIFFQVYKIFYLALFLAPENNFSTFSMKNCIEMSC